MTKNVLVLAGDGIGPEIIAEAVKALKALEQTHSLSLDMEYGLIGGAAYEVTGKPLPDETLAKAKQSDAILFGSIGGPQWENIERDLRPERGLLALRAGLGLFGNLRPAVVYPQLAAASALRNEIVAGLDIMIVRELTGGIYFGQPRGIRELENGEREGYNSLTYSESEIRRIAKMAFEIAMERNRRVCSVDKANVMEAMELWREIVTETAKDFPEVTLEHKYVDNAAMQLVRDPKQFDVLVTGNMFGDILSDLASMLTGSIGLLPSASLNESGLGMYEPIHGSAPDIAGQNLANPLATILSAAMMLRYSLHENRAADALEQAVEAVLGKGIRTPDIHTDGMTKVGTDQMGDAVVTELMNQ